MLVGISPVPCVAETTRKTSCASRSATVAALALTSTLWPAASSTGFSASATIWALPDSVPTRIRILAIGRQGTEQRSALRRGRMARSKGPCQSDGDGGNTGPVGGRRWCAHPDAQPPPAAERHEQRPDRGDESRAC